MARKPFMAGNWKMNLDHLEAIAHVQKVAFALSDDDFEAVEVGVMVPFTDIRSVQTLVDADSLKLVLILEVGGDGNEINGGIPTVELKEAGEERLVRGEIDIIRGEAVRKRVEDTVADKNAPQNGLFGFNAVRGDPAEQIVCRPVGIGGGCHEKILCL